MSIGDFMGNIISAMLPSIFFVNFYENNKKNKKWVVLYAKLLFISNIISTFIIYKYFNFTNFENSIVFSLRYGVISFIVNLIMMLIYKVVINYIKVKVEIKKVDNK